MLLVGSAVALPLPSSYTSNTLPLYRGKEVYTVYFTASPNQRNVYSILYYIKTLAD